MREVFGVTDERWKTTSELGFSSYNDARSFRDKVQAYNNNFGVSGQDTYILSGSKGYKLTDDINEIEIAIRREEIINAARMKQTQLRKKNLKRMKHKDDPLYLQLHLEEIA